jgi:hypothetical protein
MASKRQVNTNSTKIHGGERYPIAIYGNAAHVAAPTQMAGVSADRHYHATVQNVFRSSEPASVLAISMHSAIYTRPRDFSAGSRELAMSV